MWSRLVRQLPSVKSRAAWAGEPKRYKTKEKNVDDGKDIRLLAEVAVFASFDNAFVRNSPSVNTDATCVLPLSSH